MRFYVIAPIEFRTTAGMTRFFDPGVEPRQDDCIIDVSDPKWGLPANWVPPVIGVRPLDDEAKAALDAARAPYLGLGQIPGVGVVVLEPIWVP